MTLQFFELTSKGPITFYCGLNKKCAHFDILAVTEANAFRNPNAGQGQRAKPI